MPKPDNIQRCISEAVATAHDLDVDMLELGKSLIKAGARLVQFERDNPNDTLLDSCKWALGSEVGDG